MLKSPSLSPFTQLYFRLQWSNSLSKRQTKRKLSREQQHSASTLLGKFLIGFLMQTAYQPIPGLQPDAFGHVDVVTATSCSSQASVRVEMEGDWSDSERGRRCQSGWSECVANRLYHFHKVAAISRALKGWWSETCLAYVRGQRSSWIDWQTGATKAYLEKWLVSVFRPQFTSTALYVFVCNPRRLSGYFFFSIMLTRLPF